MANDGAQKANVSGWGREIVTMYETFLLRDLLGYVFPGAVVLLGAGRFLFNRPWTLETIQGVGSISWLTIALGLSAAYSVGVLLRLVGTWTHILVIAPVAGWLGDPWDLKGTATANRRSLYERVWRSPYEDAVVDRYRGIYAERSGNLSRVSDREDVFLHLTGTLGLALLVVGLLSFVARPLLVSAWTYTGPSPSK